MVIQIQCCIYLCSVPLECTLTGNGIDEPVTVSCDGSLPSNVDSSSVECRLDDDIIVDCNCLKHSKMSLY